MTLGLIKYFPILATLARTFFINAKHDYKVKTFDKTKEKINTIEHMIVKLDKKVGECRNEIEYLKQQIMLSRLINIVLAIIIIALMIVLICRF